MELSEIVKLFSARSKYKSITDVAKIETVVQELKYLALTVTLAGSYVSEIHLKLDKYLKEYRQRRKNYLPKSQEI